MNPHISRYQGKLSGPLLDRIDLHIEVPAVSAQQLLDAPAGESTDSIRRRGRNRVRLRFSAQASAAEFGIENCFVAFMPKPNVLLDDQAVADWRLCMEVHPLSVSDTSPEQYWASITDKA